MAWDVPSTFVALATLTASQLNQIRNSLKAIGDPWTSYTPTTTNITLGTGGTATGAYVEAGKLIHFRVKVVLGTGGALTGSPTVTLPVAASGTRTVNAVVTMFNTSAASGTATKIGAASNSSTTVLLVRDDASAVLGASSPFGEAWASGDELLITGTYEAA